MSENNDNSNESNSMSSDSVSVLQSSRLASGANPLLRTGVLRPSVLGPSMLCSSTPVAGCGSESKNTDNKPQKEMASNPFLKEEKDDEEHNASGTGALGSGEEKEAITKEQEKAEGNTTNKKKIEDEDEADERPDPITFLRKNGIERANLFAAAKNSIPRVEKSGFVFGQNVHERVVGENINPESASKTLSTDGVGSTSGELLFSSVIQNAAASKTADSGESVNSNKDAEAKSLTDVAREYEESRAQKRKFEEVATFTGEENEVNIVDVNCKLFAFVNSNWEERGRGSLRLNDSKNEQECSRVVFRTSGNLRLLLNTKVWAGMVAERPSQKSLRLTAMDNTGKIKIFLVMARPVDINQLHKALVERIDLRKASHPEECHVAVGVENNGEETKNGSSVPLVTVEDGDVDADLEARPKLVVTDTAAIVIDEAKVDEEATEPSPKKSLIASGAETQN